MELPEVGDYLRDKETSEAARVFRITDTEISVVYLISDEKVTYSKYDFWEIFSKIEYYEVDDAGSGKSIGVFFLLTMALGAIYACIIWYVLYG